MKLNRKKVSEEIADNIIDKIKNGDYTEGDRLPSIDQLAHTYDVSKSSVREALNILSTRNIVDIKHGNGTYILHTNAEYLTIPLRNIDESDIKNLLELRKIVEASTAHLAAKRYTADDLKDIEAALNEMQDLNGEVGEEADFKFHLAIAQATKNQMLKELLNDIADNIIKTMKETRKIWLFQKKKSVEKIYDEHLQIFLAIKEQDSDQASLNMIKHLEGVEKVLLKNIK